MSYYPGQQIEIEAFVYGPASRLTAACIAGATTLTVADPSRWSAGQSLKLSDGDPQMGPSEIVTIGSISGAVVTLSAGTLRAHPAATMVARILDATIAGTVEKPNATTSSVTLSSVTTGRYRGTFTLSLPGTHDVEVTASGAAVGSNATTFDVQTDRVA